MDGSFGQMLLVGQVVLVTLFLLSASVRARRQLRSPRANSAEAGTPITAERTPERRGSLSRPTPRAARSDARDEEAALSSSIGAHKEELASLAHALAQLRAAHAEEESHFRMRRREALLEMQDHRRITAGLCAEEPQLRSRVEQLRSDLEHLEHRRTALAAEIAASVETSKALRDRTLLAQRELASVRLDRERVGRRIRSDGERLRDLARRRAVLRAETQELNALLEMLQRLADQPESLTLLTDGELRNRRAARADGMPSGVPVPDAPPDADAEVASPGPRARRPI